MSNGPNIVRDGLVFYYDVNNSKSYVGKPSTNFYTNGDFTNGSGITQEAGSNPTNQIVIYPNPGNSQYVLRQTGNYTEYQINLTSQLSSSTTYVLSGWYAESNDYDGTSTMFHCRAFSSSGSHVALGNGIGTVIKTVNAGGLNWKYCYTTITTPSDYNGDFNWYLGYGQPSCNGYRYYTNIQMELGSYPTTFVDGSRSTTQGLKDFTRNSTIDLTNVTFNSNSQIEFDGTNDYLNTLYTSVYDFANANFSEEVWFYANTAPNGTYTVLCSRATYGSNERSFELYIANDSGTPYIWFGTFNGGWTYVNNPSLTNIQYNQWNHVVATSDGAGNGKVYINGVLRQTNSSFNTSLSITSVPLQIGAYVGGAIGGWFNGQIPIVKLYNRELTTNEVYDNYNVLKHRFGL